MLIKIIELNIMCHPDVYFSGALMQYLIQVITLCLDIEFGIKTNRLRTFFEINEKIVGFMALFH